MPPFFNNLPIRPKRLHPTAIPTKQDIELKQHDDQHSSLFKFGTDRFGQPDDSDCASSFRAFLAKQLAVVASVVECDSARMLPRHPSAITHPERTCHTPTTPSPSLHSPWASRRPSSPPHASADERDWPYLCELSAASNTRSGEWASGGSERVLQVRENRASESRLSQPGHADLFPSRYTRLPREYTPSTPFLNWSKQKDRSRNGYSPIFKSLVKMMKKGYVFDGEQQLEAVKLLDILHRLAHDFGWDLPVRLFPHRINKIQAFVDHMLIIFTCPYEIVATAGLSPFAEVIQFASIDFRFSFVQKGWIGRLMLIFEPLTRHFEGTEEFLDALIRILNADSIAHSLKRTLLFGASERQKKIDASQNVGHGPSLDLNINMDSTPRTDQFFIKRTNDADWGR
ncbi:hypothetical protein BLNAU_20675 [Blattamonas nauphoetae]|uniref:Uncharacterized protein n=1 Tax=Blattamonas nauphoetae TaxID=2049346 RepID=A0ABQ9WY24_9EUKA|nr:hypothetical protein BLNAU_20675 [Blattamonas nauphoetae]